MNESKLQMSSPNVLISNQCHNKLRWFWPWPYTMHF